MTRRIAIIQGHPDPAGGHFCHALADAYAQGAKSAGHEVLRVEVSQLDFPLLRTKEEFYSGEPPSSLKGAQEVIASADHLVVVYPLWLGEMPALLKAFFEQTFRPGFAFEYIDALRGKWKKLLKGKSARIIVTMGMPAFIYRWYFAAHGLRNLERNILGFCGVAPARETLIGMIDGLSEAKRKKLLATMVEFGQRAS
jgi:putative NADPH-quinone reductase